jgi:hypothetical protein
MNLYRVNCGNRQIISDAKTPEDAAGDMLDLYKNGETVPNEVSVLDILTDMMYNFDTLELMTEMNFEFEDE